MVERKEELSPRLSAGSPTHFGRNLLRDPEGCKALVAAFRWLHLLPMVESAVHAADVWDGFLDHNLGRMILNAGADRNRAKPAGVFKWIRTRKA
jgi:hypothetical protein